MATEGPLRPSWEPTPEALRTKNLSRLMRERGLSSYGELFAWSVGERWRAGDVVAWPTNLGWMREPWLIFAAPINHAAREPAGARRWERKWCMRRVGSASRSHSSSRRRLVRRTRVGRRIEYESDEQPVKPRLPIRCSWYSPPPGFSKTQWRFPGTSPSWW